MNKTYVKMCIEAKEIQELLKDKFDFRSQGYCTQHQCMVIEDSDGSPICPGFEEKIHSLVSKEHPILTEVEESMYFYGSPEDCMHNKKWIGLPTQEQLQSLLPNWTLGAKVKGLHVFFAPEEFCPDDPVCEKCQDLGSYARRNFKTVRELWLGLVMWEEFGKCWDGRTWIRCSRRH